MLRSRFLSAVILGLVASCGNGGGGGVPAAPVVVIRFPPPSSLTDSATITVTGTASDANGVAEVSVNGVLAATTDGFASWEVDVPLAVGANTLTVAAQDNSGLSGPQAAQVEIELQTWLDTPFWITLDPALDRALVMEIDENFGSTDRLVAADLRLGQRVIVSK